MSYLVHNLNGTSTRKPDGYNSWLEYWEAESGKNALICHRDGCYKIETLDGAHVQLKNGSDNWYIVPLCHPHNMSSDSEFYVSGPLVPVNSANSVLW